MIISVASEMRVVGQDPEHADIVNPRGEIFGEVFFVTATTTRGEVEMHDFHSMDVEQIRNLAARIQEHLDDGEELNADHWLQWRSIYGSPAWDEMAEVEREHYEELHY